MAQTNSEGNHNEVLVKFLAPRALKRALEKLAAVPTGEYLHDDWTHALYFRRRKV